MKYPWYAVGSRYFGGIYWGGITEGIFDTLEEAKACYDSVELDDLHCQVYVVEFYEDSCERILLKERKLNQPTPETMGRAKYISIRGGFKDKKNV